MIIEILTAGGEVFTKIDTLNPEAEFARARQMYGEEDAADWREHSEPEPTLDEVKAAKWSKVKAERDRLEASGFIYLDKTFDSDPTSVIRLTVAVEAARAALAGGMTGMSFDWTLQDNTVATLTAEEFIGLPLALAANADALHQHARALREQIDAATTAEEVEAIPVW